jgi:hypothetical protein
VVIPPSPPVPAAPVTLPVANAFAMLPVLEPTSPPPVPFEPTLTLPCAYDWPVIPPEFSPTSPPTRLNAPPLMLPLADDPVIVPKLVPTSPPAIFKAAAELEPPTLTVAAELEFSIRPVFCPTSPPAIEEMPEVVTAPVLEEDEIDPATLWPTSPPTRLNEPPVTLPLADDPVMDPRFVPTSPPAILKALELESPTLTMAAELEFSIRPVFCPTSPPAIEERPEAVTAPVLEEDEIDPATLWPTSPPTRLNAPPLTLPLADDPVMDPRFVPTSPPAMLKATVELGFPMLTVAADLES